MMMRALCAVSTLTVLALSVATAATAATAAGVVSVGGGGAGGCAGSAAAALAALLVARLPSPSPSPSAAPAAPLSAAPPPPACRRAPPDSPACVRALQDRLQRSYITGEPNVEMGVALDAAANISWWRLRERGLDYLGDLAPPARRLCLAAPAAAAAALAAHSDLRDARRAAAYELAPDRLALLLPLLRDRNGQLHWVGEESVNGSYTPEWCGGAERGPCADLVVGDAAEAALAAEAVRRWRWRARVRAVGDRLEEAVRALAPGPLLLCAWEPRRSALAAALPAAAAPLAMPPCDDGDDFCPYEPRRLAKLAAPPALVGHPLAPRLLARVTLTAAQHRDLVVACERSGPERGARDWLERHEALAAGWAAGASELRVAAALPASGPDGAALAAAARLAERHAASPTPTPGPRLKVETYDAGCSAARAVKYLSDAAAAGQFGELAALVGPACGRALRAAAAHALSYRLPVVAYTATAPAPGLLLAAGDARDSASALAALLSRYGWRRLVTLTEAGARSFVDPSRLRARLVHRLDLPDSYDTRDYDTILQWARESASLGGRVVALGCEDGRVARAALCAGAGAGLEPARGAVWLLPATLPRDWLQPAAGDAHPCSAAQLQRAAAGHLSVGGAWLEPAVDAAAAQWRLDWSRECAECDARDPPALAALLYDALTLTTRALAATLAAAPAAALDLHRPDHARLLMEQMRNSNYSGVTGPFTFRPDGARDVPVNVYQWENGSRRLLGQWQQAPGQGQGQGVLHLRSEPRWLAAGGAVPDDGTERCALAALAGVLGLQCHAAELALAGAVLALLAVALAAAFALARRRLERRYRRRLAAAAGEEALALRRKAAGLDRWELPRERVVINRRLGAGAFGAVYGGHAMLADGRGWTAVAVKTLRPGAGTEEKLDFLSEAETMKRFDHRNVVRLLAVITATEPACSVMELLLYGDLKSYLLARRHVALGAEGSAAGAEVSPRRLAGWALDAARALSYLAEMRYVHRDVAARNCLLSAQRVLKLADFGMTRLVFENDYYRFSRKGMLPVRWMAPESLCLGVFSPASDVWSFGVLLYEIVTFGALPFQGLSNAEVLAQVKAGRAAPLPSGLKPQLEGLIKSCWRREARARPPAAEVAALLAHSPRLLTPCLDLPLDALPFDAAADAEARWRAFRPRRDTGGSGARSTSAATDATYLSTDVPDVADATFLSADVPDVADATFLSADVPDVADATFLSSDMPDATDTDAFLP